MFINYRFLHGKKMILHYTGPHWHRITWPNRRFVCASNPNVNQDLVSFWIWDSRFTGILYNASIIWDASYRIPVNTPFVSLQPQNQIVTAFLYTCYSRYSWNILIFLGELWGVWPLTHHKITFNSISIIVTWQIRTCAV